MYAIRSYYAIVVLGIVAAAVSFVLSYLEAKEFQDDMLIDAVPDPDIEDANVSNTNDQNEERNESSTNTTENNFTDDNSETMIYVYNVLSAEECISAGGYFDQDWGVITSYSIHYTKLYEVSLRFLLF